MLTVGELISLLVAFYLRHALTKVCFQDLLILLNIIVPRCVPPTKYFFERYFTAEHKAQTHYYCKSCQSYLGSNASGVEFFHCASCGVQVSEQQCRSDRNHFLVNPLKEQLKHCLEKTDFWKTIEKGKFGPLPAAGYKEISQLATRTRNLVKNF